VKLCCSDLDTGVGHGYISVCLTPLGKKLRILDFVLKWDTVW